MTQDHYVRNNKTSSYLCLNKDSGELLWDFYLPAATPFTLDVAKHLASTFKLLDVELFSDLTIQQISSDTIKTEFEI